MASWTEPISFRQLFHPQTWHMVPFYLACVIVTPDKCTSSHMSLTVALRPFHIVFITCWWWWVNVGVNFTALTYITATFSGKRHLLKIRWQHVVNWPEALGHEEFAAKRSCVVYTTKSQYLTSQINMCLNLVVVSMAFVQVNVTKFIFF